MSFVLFLIYLTAVLVRPIEMFDLEWRLDELSGYAAWFARPHTGNRDDQIAYEGLLEELDRP